LLNIRDMLSSQTDQWSPSCKRTSF